MAGFFSDHATRPAAVAGRFYPGDPSTLSRDVRRYLSPAAAPARVAAQAVVVPHAGYVYSGAIAGATYSRILPPARAIVLCPNHTGRGSRRAVSSAQAWALPGGAVPADAELGALVVREAGLELDDSAHALEHAAEVHLPFLRELAPAAPFVAACLGGLSYRDCEAIGLGLARAIRAVAPDEPRSVLLVASSDMSHYVPAAVARELDALAIERVVALDPAGLYAVVRDHDISMCGVIPATVALVAAVELGAARGELVRYGTSGDVTRDEREVVGYAGIIVS